MDGKAACSLPDALSPTIFDHRLKKYLLAIELGRGSDAEIEMMNDRHLTRSTSLAEGRGQQARNTRLAPEGSGRGFDVTRFGEEWMAAISHDPGRIRH